MLVVRRLVWCLAWVSAALVLLAACSDQATPAERADRIVEEAGAMAIVEEDDAEQSLVRLLPDPNRWVVVEDWSDEMGEVFGGSRADLVFAPLDDNGVPDLAFGERIDVMFVPGNRDELDARLGDSASIGQVTTIEIVGDGEARFVANEEMGFATGVAWTQGLLISVNAQHEEALIDELLKSLDFVDEATWDAARASARDNVGIAVEAAIQDLPPLPPADAPLPHFVLPDPWQLVQVTDKTIWTDEQRAQEAALVAATFADRDSSWPTRTRMDFFGAVDASGESEPFLPAVVLSVSERTNPVDDSYSNGSPVTGLGLAGYIERGGSGASRFSLGAGTTTSVGVSTSTVGADGLHDFLAVASLATDDPLDGVTVDTDQFVELPLDVDGEFRPASWHAWWEHPDGDEASMSVFRLSVDELRARLVWRDYRPPNELGWNAEIWQVVAEQGVIDFGRGMTYDVEQGLLYQMQGIAPFDLVAIELDDWIELAALLNTDPLRPR